jgi:tyrosine-protein kinase Etk/Wzc
MLSKNEFTYKNKVYQYGDIIKNEENVLFKLDKRNIDTEYPYTFRVKINNPTIISEEIRETITTLIPSKNSTYIEVSLLYPLPKKGVFILNKLIEDFQQNNIKEAKRINDSIIKLIDKRLDLINEQLSELGVNQQKFKESRKITFLNDDAQSILEEMRNTDNEIIGMQVRLENINRIDKSLSDNATLLSPPNVDLNDPVLTSLINDYNQRNNEKEKIIYRSGSEHPNVISISENLYKIKISIIDNIRIQRERIQRNLQLLKRKRDELNTDISNIPYSEKNLIEILREKNIREKIYSYLLERREEASIYDLSEITKTRIIDRAYSSIKPISPSKKIIAAIILFAIIIIPTAIIYFYQKFNPRILNETFDKLNSYTIIGGLNRIKQFNYDQIKNKGIIGLRDEFQQISQYLARNKKKIIMVAGLSGNEGVRFSVLNIIMCLSAWNKRTILLDLCVGDSKVLRDISVRERLSIKKKLNIKVKSEHSSLFSFSEIKDFDIGEINEHENLSSYQNYQELINELSQQYEYMIIHAPSVIKNILAQRIDTLTDINIIVVRENVTRVDHFQELQNITSMQNLKEPLIIINDK